jgi:TrmH family RNA methyltransferase
MIYLYYTNHLNEYGDAIMKTITSRQNPEVMSTAALGSAKERALQHKFVAEGLRSCYTLLQSPIKLLRLYVTENLAQEALRMTSEESITVVSEHVMEKMSQATTPSGMLGVFRIPMEQSVTKVGPGLLLAGVTDPGNMGTLIRTCAAMNVKSVVIVEGVDPWSPKVVQATAGTIGSVEIFQISSQDLLKKKNTLPPLCALIVDGGEKPSSACNKSLLVVGSEAHGIKPEILDICNKKMTLPMPGGAESLNAAVAGSIALYMVFSS